MDRLDNLDEIVMSILFVAGQGVEIEDIASKLNVSVDRAKTAIESLKQKYVSPCGINVITYKNKVQLSSNPEYSDFIADVLNPIKEKALTKAALETMAIIAYKQPITRLEIESVRGVSSDYAIQVLLGHNLIEVVGRKDVVGKPLLFGTTEEFLKRFDLSSLEDLPNYETLLERIQILNVGNTTESMYNEYDIGDGAEDDEGAEEDATISEPQQVDSEIQQIKDEFEGADIDTSEIPEHLKGEADVQYIC